MGVGLVKKKSDARPDVMQQAMHWVDFSNQVD